MSESGSEDSNKRKLEKHLRCILRLIQNIKDPSEKQASITFCIANLVLQNCDEIEALGLLEKVKKSLGEIHEQAKVSHQPSLFYIS